MEIGSQRAEFESRIDEVRVKFEESIKPLVDEQAERFAEIEKLSCEEKVVVGLEDLILELSKLTGISYFDIGVKSDTNVSYWGVYDMKKMMILINDPVQRFRYFDRNQNGNYFSLVLFSNKNIYHRDDLQKFCYEFSYVLDFNNLQMDGRTLLDHCSIKSYYDDLDDEEYTKIVVDKNVGKLKLVFDLKDLVRDDVKDDCVKRYYPVDLLMQAVLNCVSKNKNSHKFFGIKRKIKVI